MWVVYNTTAGIAWSDSPDSPDSSDSQTVPTKAIGPANKLLTWLSSEPATIAKWV